ncbi:hypothetical protein SRIMM317S_04353 [Streptomyces rimosus subsp. rimosus]
MEVCEGFEGQGETGDVGEAVADVAGQVGREADGVGKGEGGSLRRCVSVTVGVAGPGATTVR